MEEGDADADGSTVVDGNGKSNGDREGEEEEAHDGRKAKGA